MVDVCYFYTYAESGDGFTLSVFCLFVCLTVIKITQKVVELFSRILVGRWGHGSDMNPLDFGTGPDHGLDTG